MSSRYLIFGLCRTVSQKERSFLILSRMSFSHFSIRMGYDGFCNYYSSHTMEKVNVVTKAQSCFSLEHRLTIKMLNKSYVTSFVKEGRGGGGGREKVSDKNIVLFLFPHSLASYRDKWLKMYFISTRSVYFCIQHESLLFSFPTKLLSLFIPFFFGAFSTCSLHVSRVRKIRAGMAIFNAIYGSWSVFV